MALLAVRGAMWMVRTSQGHPGRLSDKSAATRAPPYDGRAAAYGEAAASLGARKKQIAKSPIPSSRRLSNQTSQTTRGHNAITDTTITTTARPTNHATSHQGLSDSRQSFGRHQAVSQVQHHIAISQQGQKVVS
jgi:hypothetical protein